MKNFLHSLDFAAPVLCSDYQPMPEFGLAAVKYFDPYNPPQLANLLKGMLDDEAALIEWGKKVAQRAQDFQCSGAASKIWSALRRLAQGAT